MPAQTIFNRDTYFNQTQIIERERLQHLYEHYLKHHSASSITYTDKDTYSPFDCLFISGSSLCFAEFKKRNISIFKYDKSFIEKTKLVNLLPLHQSGGKALFIIEYQEAFVFFNLSSLIFEPEAHCNENYDYNKLAWLDCTSDNFNYQRNQTKKLIRYLSFEDAFLILSK
ncbi:MAG TPA: hypothetical protein VD927_11355 [Chryseosolibacter sp.]|nr:hypothetical protein [Chryseosolibacter sp.]